MITTTYGYKLPQDGDRGSIFWDALEFNISRVDQHDHDGSDSKKLTSVSIENSTQSVPNTGWVLQGNGIYRQLVSMPSGLAFATSGIEIRDAADNSIIYPTITKVGASSFYIFINDNTKNLTVVYT